MIRVVKDEWSAWIDNVRRVNLDLEKIIPKTMRSVRSIWVRRAQGITRLKGLIRTGEYLEAWKTSFGEVKKNGNYYTIDFGNDKRYAGWLERGTGIYGERGTPIVPKTAKYLSWVGKDGKRYFAKSVKGIKPQRVGETAITGTENLITNEFDMAVTNTLRGLEKNARSTRKSAIMGFERRGIRTSFE